MERQVDSNTTVVCTRETSYGKEELQVRVCGKFRRVYNGRITTEGLTKFNVKKDEKSRRQGRKGRHVV